MIVIDGFEGQSKFSKIIDFDSTRQSKIPEYTTTS